MNKYSRRKYVVLLDIFGFSLCYVLSDARLTPLDHARNNFPL